MKKFRAIILLFPLFLLTACAELENIEIGDPEQVKIQGFEDNYLKLFVGIPVNNPSFYNIKITDIDMRVYLNGTYIGKLIVDESVVIKRKKNQLYELPVKIRLANVLGAAFVMMNLKQGQEVQVRFDGTVTGKSLLVKKTFDVDETSKVRI